MRKQLDDEKCPFVVHHQIDKDENTISAELINIIIDSAKDNIALMQGDQVIFVSKWQALELAKELLNQREVLKKQMPCSCITGYCTANVHKAGREGK